MYLPGALLALLSIYYVSSQLDRFVKSKECGIFSCLAAGVGVAIAVLLVGVVAFGVAGVFLAWLDEVTPLRTGAGPFTSLVHSIHDYIVKPILWASLLGGWIAILMGITYGIVLRKHMDKSRKQRSARGLGAA